MNSYRGGVVSDIQGVYSRAIHFRLFIAHTGPAGVIWLSNFTKFRVVHWITILTIRRMCWECL